MAYSIYILLDDKHGRYVGKSNQPKYRFSRHLKDKSKSHKVSWIQSCLNKNIKLKYLLIEENIKNEDEAYELEDFYISYFKMLGADLVNERVSRKGKSGWHHKDDAKKAMSLKRQKEKHPLWGKKGKDSPRFGQKNTLEQRKKQSDAQKGEKNYAFGKTGYLCANSKVLQISLKTGEIIQEFGSGQEAKRKTNINQSDVSECCRGKTKTAGGYAWRFK